MHPITCTRWPRLWGGLLLFAGLAGTAAYGQQPAPPPAKEPMVSDVQVDPRTGALIVPAGGVVRFDPKLDGAIPTDILITREDVLGVRLDPNKPGSLLLTGRIPGLTRISLIMKDKPRVDVDVVVQPDYALLRNLIKATVPTANVDVTPGIGNVIILSGYVTSPQDADIILRLAQSQIGGMANNVINAVQVGGVQQVQIDVVIASVDRDKTRSRGFDFFLNGQTFQFNSLVSGLIGSQALAGPQTVLTPSPNANLQFAVAPTQFFGALRALKTEGLAKYLAEPRVVTQTGRPAFFLAGGRQAVLGPASGINGPGVQFEQIGTTLEVLPIVYGNNQIWLEINPTVKTVNQSLGITTTFGTTPGFSEQQARCAVMLESGQTFVIGGLIQNTITASSARVPVLGELPFLGTAFSTVTYDEHETELVIMVTPRLVAPLDCNQAPKRVPSRETRSPDDYELFLEGILEAPRGQRKVWNGRCYNAAYKCDPTIGAFPCVGPVCTGPGSLGVFGPAGNCGPNGCAVPTARVAPGPVPAPLPGPTPPPVPGTPGVLAPLPPAAPTASAPEPVAPPAGPAPLPATLPTVPGSPVTAETNAGPTTTAQPPVAAPQPAAPPLPLAPVDLPPAVRN